MIEERTLEILGFPAIRQMLSQCCSTAMGQERASGLHPAVDLATVAQWQEETGEADQVLGRHSLPSFSSVHDLRGALNRAGVGGSLDGEELWRVYSTLGAIKSWRRFSDHVPEHFQRWREVALKLTVLPELEGELAVCIGPDGNLLDSASPRLAQLRRDRRKAESALREKLESYLRLPEWQRMLQDLAITQRDNRYVLPVKQEFRQHFAGIIHGQSASGATLFIEPMPVVEMNNRLRLLEDQETEEVALILERLSRSVEHYREEISASLEAVALLDFFLAKARLSRDLKASAPRLKSGGGCQLMAAKHPLLPATKVVPIDISLGQDYDILVITGPNTGGKTVSLKTVGLLTVMAQAGLHIPAAPGSEIPVFTGVFADIGDEQSIQQSLSTFSGHMKNLVGILEHLEPLSLVLLDEIGAGTDPTEGAALAQAILEELRGKGAKVMVTTHLGLLKIYAHHTPRVANAAVEFDSARLQPTYRLHLGLPGRSNALEIADSLGLNRRITQRARELLGAEQQELSSILASLENERREYRWRQAETAGKEQELEKGLQLLFKEKREFEEKREEILRQARQEARAIMKQTQAEAKAILRELQVVLDEEGKRTVERTRQRGQEELRNLASGLAPVTGETPAETRAPLTGVKLGQWVWIPRLGQRGQVVAGGEGGGEAQVMVGRLRLNLAISELELLPDEKKSRTVPPAGFVSVVTRDEVAPSIMVRGLTTDEALDMVEKYLDDAVLAGLTSVVIIHGKGTGTLRRAVHSYLKSHPLVKGYRLGGLGEGGSGVTVVDFNP